VKVFFVILLLFVFLIGCESKENRAADKKWDDMVSSLVDKNNETVNSKVDLFSNLVIFNVSVSKEINDWYRIKGEIKNNNNVRVMGYFKLVLYDKDGSIIDAVLISMPNSGGLAAGDTGVFAMSVSQTKFDSYKFQDSTLMEN
jgi:hypothetical protein